MAETFRLENGTAESSAVDDEYLHHLYVGGEFLASGRVVEAKESLERAFELQPKNPKGQNLLGLTYFKLGLYDRAVEIYKLLVRDNPVDPTLRVNLGLVHLKTGAVQQAIRELETAVELKSDHAKAHNYLGLAYAQASDFVRARECFLAAGKTQMVEKMDRVIAERKPGAPAAAAEVGERTAEKVAEEPESNLEAASAESPAEEGASDWALGADAEVRAHAPEHDVDVSEPEPESRPPSIEVPIEIEGPLSEAGGPLDDAAEPPAEPESDWAQGGEATAPPVAETEQEFAAVVPPMETEPGEPEMPEVLGGMLRQSVGPVPLLEMPQVVSASPDQRVEPVTLEMPEVVVRAELAPRGEKAAEATRPQPAAIPALADLTAAVRLPSTDAGPPFEVTPDLIVIRVENPLHTRLEGMLGLRGALKFQPVMKRFRGKATDKPFGDGDRRMVLASGLGSVLLAPRGRHFVPFDLGDESAYFREDVVFAFEEPVVFENGRVPSKVAPDLHLVHLSGRGRVLLCLPGPPRSAELHIGTPYTAPMSVLAGWHGNITPQVVGVLELDEAQASIAAVELTGEGFAIVA